jgi:hypothetical protein
VLDERSGGNQGLGIVSPEYCGGRRRRDGRTTPHRRSAVDLKKVTESSGLCETTKMADQVLMSRSRAGSRPGKEKAARRFPTDYLDQALSEVAPTVKKTTPVPLSVRLHYSAIGNAFRSRRFASKRLTARSNEPLVFVSTKE